MGYVCECSLATLEAGLRSQVSDIESSPRPSSGRWVDSGRTSPAMAMSERPQKENRIQICAREVNHIKDRVQVDFSSIWKVGRLIRRVM